jgi:hypothetical protein
MPARYHHRTVQNETNFKRWRFCFSRRCGTRPTCCTRGSWTRILSCKQTFVPAQRSRTSCIRVHSPDLRGVTTSYKAGRVRRKAFIGGGV